MESLIKLGSKLKQSGHAPEAELESETGPKAGAPEGNASPTPAPDSLIQKLKLIKIKSLTSSGPNWSTPGYASMVKSEPNSGSKTGAPVKNAYPTPAFD